MINQKSDWYAISMSFFRRQVGSAQTLTNTGSIQIQTTSNVGIHRAQTVQYQPSSGETINLAIIQPLFLVSEPPQMIQQLDQLSVQSSQSQASIATTTASLPNIEIVPCERQLTDDCSAVNASAEEISIDAAVSLKPKRKPKRAPDVIKAQREEYIRSKIERHAVKPPCKCKFRCYQKISEPRRVEINRQYWQLPYDKQRDFILHSVEILDVKRRKKSKADRAAGKVKFSKRNDASEGDEGETDADSRVMKADQSEEHHSEDKTEGLDGADNEEESPSIESDQKKFRRGWTRVYSLKGDDGKFVIVCKAMFLTTLGFPEKVDGALRFLNKQQKGDIRARSPQRGKATPMKGATAKIDRDIIKNHIMSYKPVVVGRKKGQTRFLLGDLSMRKMHQDFLTKYTERNVSYTIYSEVFRSLNIGFRRDQKVWFRLGRNLRVFLVFISQWPFVENFRPSGFWIREIWVVVKRSYD